MKFLKAFNERVNVIVVFFTALFILACFSSFIFSVSLDNVQQKEELPSLEIHDFHLFNLDEDITMDAIGTRARKYTEKDIYDNFIINRINDNGEMETLRGQEAIGEERIYNFTQGVEYEKTPHTYFFSEKGVYDMNKKVFIGSGSFTIYDKQSTTNGQDIFYDEASDIITAKNITSRIMRFDTKG